MPKTNQTFEWTVRCKCGKVDMSFFDPFKHSRGDGKQRLEAQRAWLLRFTRRLADRHPCSYSVVSPNSEEEPERRAETTLERRIRHLAVLNNLIAAPGESYAADYTDRLCSRHLVLRRLRDGRRDGVLSVDKTPETLLWELKEQHAKDP